jgi:hypothetical protein
VDVSNGSAVEALWALGAPEPKERLKRPDAQTHSANTLSAIEAGRASGRARR